MHNAEAKVQAAAGSANISAAMNFFRCPHFFKPAFVLSLVAVCCFGVSPAPAVILLGDGSPAANTTAPTGDLAGSGWQFQGLFGSFLGTPIASKFFITAKHVGGGTDSVFQFNGTTYPLVRQYSDVFSDLTIWEISGSFPSFAPLYTSGGETGQRLVVIGRGTQRGGEIVLNTLRGWNWGPGDGVQRWGENFVNSIVQGGPANAYVYATFDQGGSPNEAHLSSGDSGGAVFIQEAGVWKLAGINYAVDGPHYADAAGNGETTAAFFDTRGFYVRDSDNPLHYSQITGATPQPTGFYSTQLSSKLGWIYSVIAPAGDVDGNGISNLLDYARALNSPAPAGPGATAVTKEGGFLTLTYRRLTGSSGLVYAVKKSNDMVNWTAVTPTETVLVAFDDQQVIKAQVPLAGLPTFLRVDISQGR